MVGGVFGKYQMRLEMKTSFKIRIRPLMRSLIRFFLFYYYETSYVMGDSGKVIKGKKVAVANTLFNVSSGSVFIGDYVIFGQNVLVLTGRHNFKDGQRAGLDLVKNSEAWGGGELEVPTKGFDIYIGQGSWIASGSIITGGVKIGEHVIVAAGAVVTKDLPDPAIAAGIPAKIIGDTRNFH